MTRKNFFQSIIAAIVGAKAAKSVATTPYTQNKLRKGYVVQHDRDILKQEDLMLVSVVGNAGRLSPVLWLYVKDDCLDLNNIILWREASELLHKLLQEPGVIDRLYTLQNRYMIQCSDYKALIAGLPRLIQKMQYGDQVTV